MEMFPNVKKESSKRCMHINSQSLQVNSKVQCVTFMRVCWQKWNIQRMHVRIYTYIYK